MIQLLPPEGRGLVLGVYLSHNRFNETLGIVALSDLLVVVADTTFVTSPSSSLITSPTTYVEVSTYKVTSPTTYVEVSTYKVTVSHRRKPRPLDISSGKPHIL